MTPHRRPVTFEDFLGLDPPIPEWRCHLIDARMAIARAIRARLRQGRGRLRRLLPYVAVTAWPTIDPRGGYVHADGTTVYDVEVALHWGRLALRRTYQANV